MKKMLKIVAIITLAIFLVLIRAYENILFYDPLLEFFKNDYKTMPLPKMDNFALQTGIALRFLLNTLISLAIIWVLFKDKEIIKLSSFLYGFLFAILFFGI